MSSIAGLLMSVLVISNVTVISSERQAPMRHVSVVISDGRIAQIGTRVDVPSEAQRIDGRGKFLIPGLIDSHVHPGAPGPLDNNALVKHPELLEAYRSQLPRAFLAFGFTTLVDLDLRPGTLAWFNAIEPHPTLYDCGPALRVTGGYGSRLKGANIADKPEDVPRAVDRVVDAGGICIKTFIEPGFGGATHFEVPSRETLAAIRAEATRRGLILVIHANAVEAWRPAIEAHADVIAHGLWHWSGDRRETTPPPEAREVIDAAARSAIGVQPTLQAVYGDLSIFDPSILQDSRLAMALPPSIIAYLKGAEGRAARRAMEDEYRPLIERLFGSVDPLFAMSIAPKRATASLRIMNADHVKLLFGSDTPSNEGIGNPPGLNGRLELSRWADAGVPLQEILRAATLNNAIAFHLSDRGTIEVGKRADLLLLSADPLKSVTAYDAIDTVILNGVPIARASLIQR
jgi:imidazolonepropionase-like amidohydrolase